MIKPVGYVPTGPEIRELTTEEYLDLAGDFEKEGGVLPSPQTATAVGIFEGGRMVGYQVLQLRLHVQPTKIDKGYSRWFSALCRKSEEVIQSKIGSAWIYVFAQPGRMAALAESQGMTVEPWVVLSKLLVNDGKKT